MKAFVKNRIGLAASRLMPSMTRRIANGAACGDSILHRVIRSALIDQAAEEGDWGRLRTQLAGYWIGGEGDAFYDAYPERFNDWFLGPHYCVVEALRTLCEGAHDCFHELYEIGCGDGRVLQHMTERFPEFRRCVGIDINPQIVTRNREVYRDRLQIQFVSGDALPWLSSEARPGSVLMSYGGVLEYFTEEEVESIFASMRKLSPSAVVLVEPLGGDYDPENESASRPYGAEHSFSHNHAVLLRKHGFEMVHSSECSLDHRWQMIVARCL